jgi:hypothetical protein
MFGLAEEPNVQNGDPGLNEIILAGDSNELKLTPCPPYLFHSFNLCFVHVLTAN